MSTGQTIITMGALILLSSMLINFYSNLAQNGTTLSISEAGISQISLSSSYFERAQELSFDEATRDSFLSVADSSKLTAPASLGSETVRPWPDDSVTEVQNNVTTYDDFDDFNNNEINDTTLASSLGTFHTSFKVYYVKPESINVRVNYRTFTKRLDMKIWRTYPPGTDTLRSSKIYGYFHFN